MSKEPKQYASATHYKQIKEVEKLAKKLGWALSIEFDGWMDKFILTPKSGWASVFNAKKTNIKVETTNELHAFLMGWESFKKIVDHIEFDVEDFKERQALLAPIKALKELK